MVKSFKKGLAMVLAVAMAFATPIAVKQADVVKAEETASTVEKISQTGWWQNEPNNISSNLTFDENGKLKFYVACINTPAGNPGDFTMDFHELGAETGSGKYITIGTNNDTWGAEGGVVDDAVPTGKGNGQQTGVPIGDIIEIEYSVTPGKDSSDFAATGLDLTTKKSMFNITAKSTITDLEKAIVNVRAQYGTFMVGVDKEEVEKAATNIIENPVAAVSADRKAIVVSVDKVLDYDSLTVTPAKDGTDLDAIPLTTGESGNATIEEVKEDKEDPEKVTATRITFNYVPKEAGAYTFKIAGKKGESTDTEEINDAIKIASIEADGTFIIDAEIFAGLNVAPADYSVSWTEKIEGATYTGTVSQGTTKVADIAKSGDKIDVSKLENGKEYTVSVTAKLNGYKDQTLTKTFTYKKEEVVGTALEIKKTTVGKTDFSTGFWGDFSDGFKLEDGKKVTVKFENHSNGADNYNNYVMAFANQTDMTNETRGDSYVEYAVVRADLFSWSPSTKSGTNAFGEASSTAGQHVSRDGSVIQYSYSGDCLVDGALNWDVWKAIIKDSDVTIEADRVKNQVTVKQTVTALDGEYKGKTMVLSEVLSVGGKLDATDDTLTTAYMELTVDGCYLNMKSASVSTATAEVVPPKVGEEVVAKTAAISFMDGPTVSADRKKITAEFSVKPDKVTATGSPKSVKISGKKVTITYKKALKLGKKIKVTATKGTASKSKTVTVKGTIKVSKVKAKKGTKKITGKLNIKKATVKVKVGKKKYKKATVKGKKFTFKTAKLKKGTKVKIKVTKKNYKTKTKTVKVK